MDVLTIVNLSKQWLFRMWSPQLGITQFNNCPELQNVSLGNGVTSVGEGAFWSCPKLESLVFPESVTEIKGGTRFVKDNFTVPIIFVENLASEGQAVISALRARICILQVLAPNDVAP